MNKGMNEVAKIAVWVVVVVRFSFLALWCGLVRCPAVILWDKTIIMKC